MVVPIIFVSVLLSGCSLGADDPFDPSIGPRNPRPGAEAYLIGRNDISESQKKALLDLQPCTPETLQVLSEAPSREVRSLVAGNPSVDESILEKLITDKESVVRQYVASNPKAPLSILVKLKDDPDENVRWQLKRNPNWIEEEKR